MPKFHLSIPDYNLKEITAVTKAIKSGWISSAGPDVIKFEKFICKKVNAKYSVALNSGTSAIHLALSVAGVKRGDEVLVQSLTYVASINPILYLGANPIFFDVDNNFHLKIDDIYEFLKTQTVFKNKKCINKKTKKIIKALLVTHLWGNVQNIQKLRNICKVRNITIIEDAAESLGSKIKIGKKIINCGCQGNLGCYSFNGNKIITTGSGGAVVTKNKSFFKNINYLANQSKDDAFHDIHKKMGFNYKLNNLLSCLGIIQLKKLDNFIMRKKKIHDHYKKEFKNMDNLKLLMPLPNTLSNYWFNVVTFKNLDNISFKKLKLMCKENGIEIRQVWKPAHTQDYLKKFQQFKIYNSEKLYKRSVCLPSSLRLSKKKFKIRIKKNKKFLSN